MIQAHSDAQAVPIPMIECLHHDYLRQQCGRFTNLYTWSELVRLYRLTSPPAPNFPPRYNVAPSQEPFSFAGLWESWRPKDAGKVETLTILTCAPNEFMARIHNRMPVMLAQDAWATWLGETDSTPEQRLAPPFPSDRMISWPVSPRVGNVKNTDAGRPVAGSSGMKP